VASPADFVTGIPHWRKFAANLLTDFPKPVIAAVNGYAIGIGCIATYCCDLIVASERANGACRRSGWASCRLMAAPCGWRAGPARAMP